VKGLIDDEKKTVIGYHRWFGFLGLVVGGTFLGSLDIYKYTGFEGYELAAYVGAIIGALIATLLGVKLALRIASQTEKKI